jgi:hypothetical protein
VLRALTFALAAWLGLSPALALAGNASPVKLSQRGLKAKTVIDFTRSGTPVGKWGFGVPTPTWEFDAASSGGDMTARGPVTNGLLASEDFYSSTPWLIMAGTLTNNAATAPDGTLTADRYMESSGNDGQGKYQNFTYANGTYVFSLYVKAETAKCIALNTTNSSVVGSEAKFDFTSGTPVATYIGANSTAGVLSAGNGWWRIWVSNARTVGLQYPEFYTTTNCADNSRVVTGRGPTYTLLIWGAQVELGSTPNAYCPTGSTAATCGSANTTPFTVTNLLVNNTTLAGAGWAVTGSGSRADNSASCPVDPTDSGRRMTLVTIPTPGSIDGVQSATAGTACTRSAYMALATGDPSCTAALSATGSVTPVTLTSTPTRYQYYNAASCYAWFTTYATGTCSRFCVSGTQTESGSAMGAYCGPTGATSKTCSTATAPKNGTPTTVGPYYYPESFTRTASAQYAAKLNGTTDYYDAGDVGASSNVSVCAEFKTSLMVPPLSYAGLVSKDNFSTGPWSWVQYGANNLNVYVYKAGGSYSTLAFGATFALNTDNYACWSYDGSGGDGAAVMLGNINGIAITPVTNGVAPLATTVNPLRVGTVGVPGSYNWNGSISKVAIWNAALSATQLANAVAALASRAQAKPSGSNVTWTRNQTQFGCPVSDGTCLTVAVNTPVVTDDGAWIGSAAANGNTILQSQTIATGSSVTSPWAVTQTGAPSIPTLLADAVAAPDLTLTADRIVFPAINGSGQRSIVYQPFTPTAASWTISFWARTDAGTATVYSALTQTGVGDTTNTAHTLTTAWQRFTLAPRTLSALEWYFALGPNGDIWTPAQPTTQAAATIYVWGFQATPTAYVGAYCATVGSACTGVADAPTTNYTETSLTTFSYGVKAKAPSWTSSSLIGFGVTNTYGAGNAFAFYASSGAVYLVLYDSANSWTRLTCSLGALAANSVHTLIANRVSNTLSIYLDGTALSCTQDGAGSGTWTAVPATITVGRRQATEELNGWVQKVVLTDTVANAAAALK